MSKSSKYILACGCSYTDPNFKSTVFPNFDCNFKKWPELVGDHLDYVVKNIAQSGIGNDLIFTRTIEDIIHNHERIELVLIGWSEWHRFASYDVHFHNPESTLKPRHPKNITRYNKASLDYYKFLWTQREFHNFVKNGMATWLKRIVMLQKLCDSYGIKHIQATLCGSVNRTNYKPMENIIGEEINYAPGVMLNILMNNADFFNVQGENIIGWPFLEQAGGFEFNRTNMIPIEYRVGGNDMHPNREGHEFIAQYYIEKYKEIYL